MASTLPAKYFQSSTLLDLTPRYPKDLIGILVTFPELGLNYLAKNILRTNSPLNVHQADNSRYLLARLGVKPSLYDVMLFAPRRSIKVFFEGAPTIYVVFLQRGLFGCKGCEMLRKTRFKHKGHCVFQLLGFEGAI